jgi:hypothetical protein
MRERTPADDIVQGASNRALLDLILDPMRRVAKDCGYAIAVHGSLNRDIDLVAVPWVEGHIDEPLALARQLASAIAGVTGRCHFHGEVVDKPHGRKAQSLLVWCGERTTHLDLSVMPTMKKDAPK